jgi:hypothetical protein
MAARRRNVKRFLSDAMGRYHRRTPLHMAAEEGNKNVAELLPENMADVNSKEDRYGMAFARGGYDGP